MSSSLSAGDVDGDGDIDLAVGGWWEGSRIYLNEGRLLHQYSDWQTNSYYNSVAEAMQFEDVDNDGMTAIYDEKISTNGAGNLFYLNHVPFREVLDVVVNGRRLESSRYIVNPEFGYLHIPDLPEADVTNISVSYMYSNDLDLLVSNWDPDKGNYIFFNNSEDKAPPYVKDHNPPRYAIDVSPEAEISFVITDSKSGVDKDSISIESNLDGIFEVAEVEDGYLIRYNGYIPDDYEVDIDVSASDLASEPNDMPLHHYTFWTSAPSGENPPVILWGGFAGSKVTSDRGGILKLWARVSDPEDNACEVQVFYLDVYTGQSLFDDGKNGDDMESDGIFSREFDVPPGVMPGFYFLKLVAVDSTGLMSDPWPNFVVK